jgi:hypothetical protein
MPARFGCFQLSWGGCSSQQHADVILVDTSSCNYSSTQTNPNSLPTGYGPDDGIGRPCDGPTGS